GARPAARDRRRECSRRSQGRTSRSALDRAGVTLSCRRAHDAPRRQIHFHGQTGEFMTLLWWQWLLFGLVLMVAELATPGGFYLLFFGVAAVIVGLLSSGG